MGGLLTSRGPPSWHPATDAIKAVCLTASQHCEAEGVDIAKLAMYFSLKTDQRIPTCLVSTASLANLRKNIESCYDDDLNDKEREVLEAILSQPFRPLENATWEISRLRSTGKRPRRPGEGRRSGRCQRCKISLWLRR